MNKLLDYIRSLVEFNDASWIILQEVLTKAEYGRNSFLFQEGHLCDSLFFIENGFCRSYYNMDGIDKNINFFFENEIVGYLPISDIFEKPDYNLIACEKLSVIKFDKVKLVQVAKDCVDIERLGRYFIRAFAAKQQEISKILKLYSAKERLKFIEQYYPNMIERVPLSQLSSFLGVARETLSRIRKQRIQS